MTSNEEKPFKIQITQDKYFRERIVDTNRFDTILPYDISIDAPQQDEPWVNTYLDPTALPLHAKDFYQSTVVDHRFSSFHTTRVGMIPLNRIGEAAALPSGPAWYVILRAIGIETDPSIVTLNNGAKALEASLDAWHDDPKHPGSIR